ncbi:UNVERIFIED_ORG: hypothetical protein JN05_05334 [Zoogloea ramigera]|uniref:Uncharacterized protein n=1 Tax=Duganella zoogloeoides TaxID=75659 RepID=A0ABZ0XTR6_9BURK|nr:hypothetical protein [Duganella zoogloeoides]WQH03134.1 hypothetical protein SR858_18990 [Duganella zoogloeoides]
MNVTPDCNYSLRIITPSTSEQTPSCELMIFDTPTGKILDGAVLEAALVWGDLLLLCMTDDVPYEEGLRIVLLDQDYKTLDSALIGAMYSTGVFSDLDLTEADTVRFRFFRGLVYTLTLLPQASFALPFFSDPGAVWRPFKWTRRFRIDTHPLPETGTPPPQ